MEIKLTLNSLCKHALAKFNNCLLSKCSFSFYLSIYPPDSQESDGGAIHRVSNYPNLLPEMPRYCCLLVI